MLVLTDAPIPVPVAETISAAGLETVPDDLMAAAGGVVLRNARHAATAYPRLWGTHKAAEHAFRRSPPTLYVYILNIEQWGTPRLQRILGTRATYRLAGAGQKSVDAWFDPVLVPDVAGWLTERLGPLAWCQVESAPDPEPVAAAMVPEGISDGGVDSDLDQMIAATCLPTDLPPDDRPAASPKTIERFYPVASDESWAFMAPPVSILRYGSKDGPEWWVRFPLGCASISRARAEMLRIAGGDPIFLPPTFPLPADWQADAIEDIGGPHIRAA